MNTLFRSILVTILFVAVCIPANAGITKTYHGAGIYSLNAYWPGDIIKYQWNIDCDTTGADLTRPENSVRWPKQYYSFTQGGDHAVYTGVRTFGKRTYLLGMPGVYTVTAYFADGSTASDSYTITWDDIPEWGTGPFFDFSCVVFQSDTMFCDRAVRLAPLIEHMQDLENIFDVYKVYINGKYFKFWFGTPGQNFPLDTGFNTIYIQIQYKGEYVELFDTVYIYSQPEIKKTGEFEMVEYFDGNNTIPVLKFTPTYPSSSERLYNYNWFIIDPKNGNKTDLFFIKTDIDTTDAFSWVKLGQSGIYTVGATDNSSCQRDYFQYVYVASSAVQDGQTRSEISLFPNPASSQVTITGDFVSGVIYEITGREVLRFGNNSNEVDISGLQPGIYIVIVTDRLEQARVLRFVKTG